MVNQVANIMPPIDPRLYRIIQEIESSNNPNAVSSKGARGLMQIMPKTGRQPGYGVTPLRDQSPEENVRFGKDYFNAMYNKFGTVPLALAAYNAGPGAVEKVGGDISKLPKETQNYVSKAMKQFDDTGQSTQMVEYTSPQKRFRQTSKQLAETSKARNVASDTPEGKKALDNLSLALDLATLGRMGMVKQGIKGVWEYAGKKYASKKAAENAAAKAAKSRQASESALAEASQAEAKAAATPKPAPYKPSKQVTDILERQRKEALTSGTGPDLKAAEKKWADEAAKKAADGTAKKATDEAAKKAADEAAKKATEKEARELAYKQFTKKSPNKSTAGAGRAAGAAGITALTTAAALSDKGKDTEKPKKEARTPEGKDFEEEMGVGKKNKPVETKPAKREPAPVEEGKPGMTRAEAEEKGIAKPEGGFWQDVADAIAGGKGKGTVEYDYPSDREDKKHGGMVYRMKGGKVGKATNRGTGKARGGAYINYGKPVVYDKSFTSAKPLKSGGKVGMRGVGKAMRGFGKAMKRGK